MSGSVALPATGVTGAGVGLGGSAATAQAQSRTTERTAGRTGNNREHLFMKAASFGFRFLKGRQLKNCGRPRLGRYECEPSTTADQHTDASKSKRREENR